MITPYAFEVADRLMGLPLATPWRRAAAMLVDLAVVGVLALLREITGPLFLLLLAWFAFRATTARSRHPVERTLPRLALRIAAVILFLLGAAQGVGKVVGGGSSASVPSPRPGGGAGDRTSMESAVAREGADVGFRALLRSVGWVSDLRSGDTARARAAAEAMARRMADAGMTRPEIRRTLLSTGAPSPDSALHAATERVVAGLDSVAGEEAAAAGAGRDVRPDSLARAWTAALEAGDSSAAGEARRRMTAVLAADSVDALQRRTSVLAAALDRMEDRLEEARDPPGPVDYLRRLAEDLGLGIGWFGLYFTAFLAVWKGRTPGKRLLGIRVVKVSGEPLGWWDAFSRVGGYAASFVTGLLGFLQITWDANRQGLHDRIAGTVVISGEPPGPGEGTVEGTGEAYEADEADGSSSRDEGVGR